MQEIKKRRIVLASLLKPVNDTRIYEKIGVSLARLNAAEVHIIGFPVKSIPVEKNIHFHRLTNFKRISLDRVFARLKVFRICLQLKPELLIVSTHELLGVAVMIRIIFGAKIVYDVQENYSLNILFTNAFPKLIRPVIAFFVRLKEWIVSPLLATFFLAEKCYTEELPFIGKKYLVLENKCIVPAGFQRRPNKEFIQLIFTGTLAESTGVFQSINIAKKLYAVEPKIRLTILGYCAQPNLLERIRHEIKDCPFISLVGGNELVDHSVIMNAIAAANFGIVFYPLSPHIENKIPTKLFEYLACRLPLLMQNHQLWIDLCAPFNAAIIVDFDQPDVSLVLERMKQTNFSSSPSGAITWESEEEKLIKWVESIF